MTQEADVKEPSEVDKMLAEHFAGREAAEKKGNTDISTPPTDVSAPKADEAIPAQPTADSTEESIDTLKAELATAQGQILELSTALASVQTALTDSNSDTWKHKFEVVDGKMKAQGPRDAQRIKDLEADNKRLKDEVEAAKTVKPAPKAEGELDDEDREIMDSMGFDEEAYKKFKKKCAPQKLAQETPKPAAAEPEPKPEPEPKTEPAKSDTAPEPKIAPERGVYLTLLNVKAPGWTEAFKNPKFAEFIETNREIIDGQPGRTYREVLIDGDARLDANAAARAYNAFLKTAKPAEAPQKPSREAADSTSKGSGGTPVAKEVWTPEKIDKFSDDVNSGKIKWGSPEYVKLKASYDNWMSNIKVAG